MQTTTKPEIKDFKCRNCKTIVGKTNGKVFIHNGEQLPEGTKLIVFDCPFCRKYEIKWKRVD
jgi:RNase P subunit RPR2